MDFCTAAESSDNVRSSLANWTRADLISAIADDAFIEAEIGGKDGKAAAAWCEGLLDEHSHEQLVEMVIELHEEGS